MADAGLTRAAPCRSGSIEQEKAMRAVATAAVLLVLAPSPAAAQPQRSVYAPVGRWAVDSGQVRCSIARRIGGAHSPVLILRSYLGQDEPEIILMKNGSEALPSLPSRVTVTLSPGNLHEEVQVTRTQRSDLDAYVLAGLQTGFFDRFAAAEAVSFGRDTRTFISLPIPQAAIAVRALRTCNDALFRSWGIDTAARDALQSQPEQIAGSIQASDYPDVAGVQGETGLVVARLNVEADGSVSNCTVVVSSRSEPLDIATCRLLSQRLRYRPALDARGHPIATPTIRTIHWRLSL